MVCASKININSKRLLSTGCICFKAQRIVPKRCVNTCFTNKTSLDLCKIRSQNTLTQLVKTRLDSAQSYKFPVFMLCRHFLNCSKAQIKLIRKYRIIEAKKQSVFSIKPQKIGWINIIHPIRSYYYDYSLQRRRILCPNLKKT